MLLHKSNRPNLLFILTDQQRYDAVGYNNSILQTPNISQLAAKSIKCTHAIVQSPQCQPSRASLLTGFYPDNINMLWNEMDIDLQYLTLANILQDYGYDTGYFGKLHFQNKNVDRHQLAARFGFGESFLTEDWLRHINLIQHEYNCDHIIDYHKAMATGPDRERSKDYIGPWTTKLKSHHLQHEDMVYHKAHQFIKKRSNSRKPFACFVSFQGPHPPYASPPPYNSMYDDAPLPIPNKIIPTFFGAKLTEAYWRNIISQYYGSISWIDEYIGKLVSQMCDNDLIVYTSDHGDILGDHGLFSKGVYTYEGNTRVPLLVKLPNTKSTITYQHIVQLIDLLPTVLTVLDIDLPYEVDGKDCSKAFLNNVKINDFAISTIGFPKGEPARIYMIRTDKHKLVVNNTNQQLFDLVLDPKENVNQIGNDEYSETVTNLKKILSSFLQHKLKNQSYYKHILTNLVTT